LAIIAGEQGDLRTHNEIFADLRERGRAAGDRNLTFVALMDGLWAETEAGNVARSDMLADKIGEFDATLFKRAEDTLSSASAFRCAWHGDFVTAYTYVKDTAEHLTTVPRRAMRFAETALYAAAADLFEESAEAASQAAALIAEAAGTRAKSISRIVFARVFLALAFAVVDKCAAGESVLSGVTFTGGVQRENFGPLVEATLGFVKFRHDPAALAAAQPRLRGSLLGGYAILIDQLKGRIEREESLGPIIPLSAAERAVLRHIERGLSSKEIAVAVGRSPQTIDTQVKSALRKLKCRGRSEAVYVARRRGLLD
jgi:DNA-binding CsgD family transcriptional regulator